MGNTNFSGETAAIKGYEFQYLIFATEIYDALLHNENQVEWIEFASNDAGKIDDVLIGLANSVLAFQIKNVSTSNFTFSTFTEASTQSILEGMFIGWKKQKTSNSTKRLDVRFITTQSASVNDKIEKFAGSSKPSFQNFLTNFWMPVSTSRYDATSIPKAWSEVLDDLVKLAKASSREEMIAFIKDTSFAFDYSMPKYFDNYIEKQRRIDIEDIAKHIFQTVGRKGNIRFSKKEFLEEFGLKRRYESYYTHSFFVDEEHYQSINETWNEIENLINTFSSGYITLIGNAGSGKSTLLTKWLLQSNYKILRYYAYVNVDMNYEFGFRGEAKTFLHDLLVQIRQSTASLQDRLPTVDLTDLQKHFTEELNKLARNEEKVIIIVDGLDHIEREQNVTRSLLSVLPLPTTIPDNIYFILGSRRIENLDQLHSRIQNHIFTENRLIKIKPLSKDKVQNLLSSYQILLSEQLLEKLFINTQGHPLFLRYTIEAIRSSNPEMLDDIISQKVFTGEIDNEYRVFWEKNKTEDDFIEILGLIARFRHSYFDVHLLDFFERITRANKIKINKLSEDYFYKTGSIWQFFHSSFKEFLLRETAKNLYTKEFDKTVDRQFHLRIYEATKDLTDDYRWNEIYHLYKAEQFSSIISLASQNYFRKQWFEYRNYKLIKEDIQLAINASDKEHDIYFLFRCFLCLFELKQRYANFDPSDYFTTFHKLGKIALANSFVYDNVELLVSQTYALDYSIAIYKEDHRQLAFDIFSRATPTFILNQTKKVSPRQYRRGKYGEVDEVKLLSTWAKGASLFMPIKDVFRKVEGITVEEEPYQHGEQHDLFADVFSSVLDMSIQLKNWDSLRTLEEVLFESKHSYEQFYFYYDVVVNLSNENVFYNHCVSKLFNWEITDDNPINRRLLKVYLLNSHDEEKIKAVFENLLKPNEVERPDYSIEDSTFLQYIFDYASFFYIITREFNTSPKSFLPQEKKHTKQAFFNAFAEIGKSFAYIHHYHNDAAVEYYLRFDELLHLFHYDRTDYGYEYSISNNKSLLINLILKISSKISSEVFKEILKRLENEWQSQTRFWSTGDKQKIIEEVIDLNGNKEWIINQLEKIDKNVFERGYLNERIDEGIVQIGLWTKIDKIEKGESILNQIMTISFDVRGEKDNQLDYIVQWLEIAPKNTPEEIEFYLARINSLNDKVNSRSHTPAIELLRLSLKFGNGFEVFRYLLFEGLITFTNGLEIALAYFLSLDTKFRMVIVKIFTRVLMAYDDYHYERHHFFDVLFKMCPKLSANELRDLVYEIKINSISEYRNDYLYRVQEYSLNNSIDIASIGIDNPIPKREQNSGSTDTSVLTLQDGRKMSSSEVFDKVETIAELQDLQKQSQSYSSFKWKNIYEKVFKNSTDNEISDFVEVRDFESTELSQIAKVLMKHQRHTIAKKLLHSAILKGENYGWVHHMDGGSKIVPFELLHKIEDKNILNRIAFKDFSDSIGSLGIESYEILLKDFNKIWSFFSDQIDKDVLYREIIEFRSELLKTHKIDDSSPSVKGNLSTEDFLLECLYFLITFPSDFGYALYTTLVEEYDVSSNIISRVLKRLFKENFFAKFIKLLAVTNTRDKSITIENKENVIYLLNNSRYDISRIAHRLLYSIGIDPNLLIIKQTKELSFMYKMEFQHTPSFLSSLLAEEEFSHIDKKGFLKQTEDPLVFINLYKTEIRVLSLETDIPIINLAYRTMTLGTRLEFPKWCNEKSEEEIRRIYDGRFDLKISYKRPRNQLVWDGLMKVIKELWELDLIDTCLADELSGEFDEYAYLIKTTPQPSFIVTILKGNSGRAPSADKGWAKELTDDYLSNAMAFRIPDNCFILAEHSIIKGMGWGYAEEIRQSFIHLHEEIVKGKDRELIFNFTSKFRMADYMKLNDKGVILYNPMLVINKRINWLAINPSLCRDLSLVFNPHEGNFRWDDKNGNKVFESFYWQTHSTDNYNKHHDSESGYGWYVVLYNEGYKNFKALITDFTGDNAVYQHRKISRHMEYSQEKYQTDIKEDFSKTTTEKFLL